MEEYKKVLVTDYVKEGLSNGTLIPKEAQKIARIIARQGKLGEVVTSWSIDNDGNEVCEKVAEVKKDNITGKLDWIATKVDEKGNIIIDNNNHANMWIISDSKFKSKYEIDQNNPLLYKPKDGKQIFVQIPDNIILSQWGSDVKIAAGGYINITNFNDMYGIAKRDFEDTYRFTSEINVVKHK